MTRRYGICCLALLVGGSLALADKPRGGLEPGERTGPYSATVSTGPNRGQSHCFICETDKRPAVIVFARKPTDPLGKLAQGIDRALTEHKKAQLRAWITFLSDDQPGLDPQVVKWGRKFGLGTLPLAVFEDAQGPPAYRLSKDAEVTVLLCVKQKVVRNFTFREGELTDARVTEILKSIPGVVAMK
jgi:hypothetical protein